MSKKQKIQTLVACCVIFVIIFLDQWLKIWVKTNMTLGQQISVFGDWFTLYFIENEGMAFGISFGQAFGKLMLSLVRIALVIFLCWYVHKLIKRKEMDNVTLVIFCLIIAGALGNILDCLFYGLIFNESTPVAVAALFPEGGGYAPFFYGKVVDMFYFKLFRIPDGFPLWGGNYFFPAIFNIADSCVTVGVIMLIIFSKRIFKEKPKAEKAISDNSQINNNLNN